VRVGVVISTVGRAGILDMLFESLANQTHRPHQVVLVDQGENGDVSAAVNRWADRLPLRRITSARGVSLGRNTGWRALKGCDVVSFPDDDITLAPDTLEAVVREFSSPDVVALSGSLAGNNSTRVAFHGGRCELGRRDVWTKTIESTTFYRMSVLEATGGFDTELGVGCATQWQSGEGTDLLLRAMEHGRAIYEPSIVLTEHQDDITHTDYLRKVRKYARGTGRVYKLRYNWFDQARVIALPLAAAAVNLARGRRTAAAAKWQAVIGRLEGMLLPADARPTA
jgi:glycosyltransferase involved in cell wall biosynthesis